MLGNISLIARVVFEAFPEAYQKVWQPIKDAEFVVPIAPVGWYETGICQMHYLQIRFKNVDDQAWDTEGEPKHVDELELCLNELLCPRQIPT